MEYFRLSVYSSYWMLLRYRVYPHALCRNSSQPSYCSFWNLIGDVVHISMLRQFEVLLAVKIWNRGLLSCDAT